MVHREGSTPSLPTIIISLNTITHGQTENRARHYPTHG